MSKVWLITGSSRGLGRHVALAALKAGDRVVATARKPEQLADLVAPYGDRARAVALDVTSAEAARVAVGEAVAAFGRIDVVVNNAGYANVASIEDVREDDFRTQFETNFYGVFHVTRAALPVLRKQRSGHVIQVSSIGGRIGSAGLGAYQSAKWGVEGFSEVLAREVAPFGVKVTLVEPGGFRTDWAGSSMTIDPIGADYEASIGMLQRRARESAAHALGDPEKAGLAIVELAALEAPPLRLLLGSDAVYLAEVIGKHRLAEDAKWRDLSVTTDFETPPRAALEALASLVTPQAVRG